MAIYFPGRKLLKEFSTVAPNQKNRIDWRVSEEWRDIDEGTASRCGVEGTCSVEVASGISEKAMTTLKEVAGGTLGLKDVWSLKTDVETSIGHEVNWQVSQKSTKTFKVLPPKCGRSALTVYQLFRIYELTSFKKNWFSFDAEKWVKLNSRIIEERTNNHDAIPDMVESDPICNCPDPTPEPMFNGLMRLNFDTIGMRVPYRFTQIALELQIDRQVLQIFHTHMPHLRRMLANGIELNIELNASFLPEPLRFLGQVAEDAVLQGYMADYADEARENHFWQVSMTKSDAEVQDITFSRSLSGDA